jgi:hypothetical protein
MMTATPSLLLKKLLQEILSEESKASATPAQTPPAHGSDSSSQRNKAPPPQFALARGWPADYLPLHLETRTHVSTKLMCVHFGVKEQTARIWACKENGPLRPIRVNGRLMWPVAGIRLALGEAQ